MFLLAMPLASLATGKSRPAIPHAFNELQLIHFSLDDAIAVRQSQTCSDSRFISLNAESKAL